MSNETPSAGWYPDESGRSRWWDGNAWTDRYADTPPRSPEPSRSRPAWVVPLIVGGAALLLGVGIGYGVGSSTKSDDRPSSASAKADSSADKEEPTVEETTEPAYVPTVDDFSVKLSVKDRECFGSAGCNVVYRVEPNYEGTESPTGNWEITYEVRGIEDGPQVETFNLEGDSFSFEPEIQAGTKSADSKVKAVITGVVEAY